MTEQTKTFARVDNLTSSDRGALPQPTTSTLQRPRRIQRRRTKGWRMPEGAIYVGRPTMWGNPFAIKKYGVTKALEYFRAFLTGEFPEQAAKDYRRAELRLYGKGPACLTLGELAAVFLRGKDLACWCPLDQPCHADVLLELAND